MRARQLVMACVAIAAACTSTTSSAPPSSVAATSSATTLVSTTTAPPPEDISSVLADVSDLGAPYVLGGPLDFDHASTYASPCVIERLDVDIYGSRGSLDAFDACEAVALPNFRGARETLARDGFTRGAYKSPGVGNGRTILLGVFEFSSADGAGDWLAYETASNVVEVFPVDLPQALATTFSYAVKDTPMFHRRVCFVKGARFYFVDVQLRLEDPGPESVVPFAQRQYDAG